MARTRRSGRKDNTERIRDVVALFGSLSRRGDSVSIEAISNRLGVSIEEAHKLMNIVCCASGEEGSHLPISSNEDETEFTLRRIERPLCRIVLCPRILHHKGRQFFEHFYGKVCMPAGQHQEVLDVLSYDRSDISLI